MLLYRWLNLCTRWSIFHKQHSALQNAHSTEVVFLIWCSTRSGTTFLPRRMMMPQSSSPLKHCPLKTMEVYRSFMQCASRLHKWIRPHPSARILSRKTKHVSVSSMQWSKSRQKDYKWGMFLMNYYCWQIAGISCNMFHSLEWYEKMTFRWSMISLSWSCTVSCIVLMTKSFIKSRFKYLVI